MTRTRRPEDDHFFRVEVTVAACIATPDDRALGDNMGDVTVGFSMSAARPPADWGDPQINAAIAHHLSAVVALVRTTLLLQGFADLGRIDEPMNERGKTVTGYRLSTPVTVTVSDEPAARA